MEAVTTILDRWADKQLSEALSRLSSKQLQSSGALRASLKKKVALESGIKARAAIKYLYYGTIQDRDFIRYGNKGISTARIEQWLRDGGMSKMGGYRGQAKSEARQYRDTAWRIRKSWAKTGGRKGRPWSFRSKLEASGEELVEQVFEAFQQETYEYILQKFNN